MTLYLLVLSFFLLAFVGLGIGLLIKGKRLRGGCGHGCDSEHSCVCKKDVTSEPFEEQGDSVKEVVKPDIDNVPSLPAGCSSPKETLRKK